VVLILLSKHTRKDFQVITAFSCSVFITSQSLFVPTNMVLKIYLPCRTSISVSQTAMRAVYSYVHTLIKSMITISCTTASVERCVSRWYYKGIINILVKSLLRRTIELQLL